MAAPLVSVIMPVYNGERYLRRSIESVFAQTYSPIELVAVDDGSTDSSAQLLASYGDHVVLVRQENGGVARARNAAIRSARGELMAFLDQDDWWLPKKIERQVDCFAADPRLGLVHTATVHYDEARGTFMGGSPPEAAALSGACYERLLLRNAIYNSSVMVRQRVFTTVGGVDVTIPGNSVQDYELWLRTARRFPFGFVAEPLTVWRLHPGQGYWNRRTMLTEELRLLERYTGGRFTGPLRPRLARLLEELGLAHLEGGESAPARRYFGRALRTQLSRRNATLYALALWPGGCAGRLLDLRTRLWRLVGYAPPDDLPVWAVHREAARR